MKLNSIRHFLVIIVGSIITIGGLVSCDPICNCDIYIENPTANKCVLYIYRDSMAINYLRYQCAVKDSIPIYDTIVINHGEKVFWFTDWEYGFAQKPRAKRIVREAIINEYHGELKIGYEDGSSVVFYPDSVNSQSHSLYDENSYSYDYIDSHHYDVTYVISEKE
ncbi:MAG: hypothetical protein J6W18_09235 [Bacteroidaceae bacterium]|nr:hypothetical protein [Bacteroidaceae bacterium]